MPHTAAVRLTAACFFAAAVAAAQQGATLKAEIDHELSRPPADSVAALEAQVERLKGLLKRASAGGVATSAPSMPATTELAPRGAPTLATTAAAEAAPTAAESRPVRLPPTERFKELTQTGRPGGGDPTMPDRPNRLGFVNVAAVDSGGDLGGAEVSADRAHMEPKKPKKTPGSGKFNPILNRSAPSGPGRRSGSRNAASGGRGGVFGGGR
jgi:hypothetical protein